LKAKLFDAGTAGYTPFLQRRPLFIAAFFIGFDFLLAAPFVKISHAKLCLAAVSAAQYLAPGFTGGYKKVFSAERKK
jgi:hypothetical protein